MASKNWYTERKWEVLSGEQHFIDLLESNGYEITGIKEWQSKTDYHIEKDGVTQNYSYQHVGNSKKLAKDNFKCFEMFYETTKKVFDKREELKAVGINI